MSTYEKIGEDNATVDCIGEDNISKLVVCNIEAMKNLDIQNNKNLFKGDILMRWINIITKDNIEKLIAKSIVDKINNITILKEYNMEDKSNYDPDDDFDNKWFMKSNLIKENMKHYIDTENGSIIDRIKRITKGKYGISYGHDGRKFKIVIFNKSHCNCCYWCCCYKLNISLNTCDTNTCDTNACVCCYSDKNLCC